MDLKPVLSQEVRKLDVGEVRAEELRRDALLKEVKREQRWEGYFGNVIGYRLQVTLVNM